MEKTNDGGPAFPTVLPTKAASWKEGMTLRDWFAGMAMAGLLANSEAYEDVIAQSYTYADLMIIEREVTDEPA